jgi:hypothetical protein
MTLDDLFYRFKPGSRIANIHKTIPGISPERNVNWHILSPPFLLKALAAPKFAAN